MSRSRTVAVLLGGVALVVALAGCSDPPQGTVTATNSDGSVVQIVSNPAATSCHRFAPIGVTAVMDGTLADMRLYASANCTGTNDYLSTNTSVGGGPGGLARVFRSYAFVGQ
ncbi:hypothetical protein DN069_27205 [Streptacidiphilus pinicola]|uniref:Uncharacterized protein n=1 Tax=Streptacidiphilus pinicola TaxID=2219663 RepID=A0A2X0IDD9_9ACTN|nr:hypothetical protein [Streptacidiphilus pinicola]RAG82537.1 hypothetical protein DN069_27205 [Streptacidiphilus pinicola]